MSKDYDASSGSSWDTLKIYWRFAKPYKFEMAMSCLRILQAVLVNIIVPIIIAAAIARIVEADDVTALTVSDFAPYLAAFIVSWALVALLNRVSVEYIHRLETYVMRDLYAHMFDYYTNQTYTFFNNNFGGSLVAKANRFVTAIVPMGDSIFLNGMPAMVRLLFPSIALMFFSVKIGLIMLIISFFISGVVVYQAIKRMPIRRRAAAARTSQTGQLADSITNAHTFKTFGHEDYEQKLYDKKTGTAMDLQLISWRSANINGTTIVLLNGFLQVVVLLLLINDVIVGAIGVEVFVLTQFYVGRVMQSFFDVGSLVRGVEGAFSDADEMTATLLQPPTLQDVKDPIDIEVKKGTIQFKDVSFRYPDVKTGESLFAELNFKVKAGEKVGLVGPSGGGKSTVTKLILRFLDIDDGQILIDQQDISKARQVELRHQISYVPQEPILFHRSLRENIRYGKLSATDEEVEEAARKAQAAEFIEKLPDGYETLVGERGVKLSGGQRQRVALARAMLKDAPILVLDEATSSLDSESEKYIQKALEEVMKGKTSLVIAHRLSTIQKMDRIIVMQEGQVVQQGPHNELVKQDGLYATLWQHQSGGFLEEEFSD